MVCAVSHAAVSTLLKDRRFGREIPTEVTPQIPSHVRAFYNVEAHSMLELEPPTHTRLRGLVLRAFTSRRVNALAPEIEQLCHSLIDSFPDTPFDLLTAYAQKLPAIIIARLLGVPDTDIDDLLRWSNAMVAMYQASRTRTVEDAAETATLEFSDYLRSVINAKKAAPTDDLISHLIAAEENGEKLSSDELITTCILLLNAGHEATVHTLGNGVNTLFQNKIINIDDATVEEILRYDPPLHLFTRWAYEDVDAFGHTFKRGDQIACLLAAANRDPAVFDTPNRFDPTRPLKKNTSFGGGIHFCVGAPLARLELQIGLKILFERCPNLRPTEPAQYADVYHFHGLRRLLVET